MSVNSQRAIHIHIRITLPKSAKMYSNFVFGIRWTIQRSAGDYSWPKNRRASCLEASDLSCNDDKLWWWYQAVQWNCGRLRMHHTIGEASNENGLPLEKEHHLCYGGTSTVVPYHPIFLSTNKHGFVKPWSTVP